MKLMLDTNVCIYLIKEHPPSVVERFASHAVGDIGISVITLAELEYGISKSSRPAKNREAAHALSLGVRLITHDVSEFGRVSGLRVEDWA